MDLKHFKKIEKLIDNNYWTNWLGLSRSLLAFSLLITLIFNNNITLFYTGIQNESYPKFSTFEFNLYSWFNNFETSIIVSIIALIVVIIGIYPRYTCIIHWFVTYSFCITSSSTDGGDQVASIITFLLIPICIFDKRKWHWSKTQFQKSFYVKCIASFSYFILICQIAIIYFFAAVGKFKVDEWVNGTAIYYWLTQPLFGAVNFYKPLIDLILHFPILTALLNWSVLFVELAIAFSIFSTNKNYKRKLLYISVFFHFFILLFLGIVSFSIIMMSCLILFLISKNNNYGFRYSFFNFTASNISNLLSVSTKKN